jgi:SNF2 family DNA or RNA helicase
MMRVPRLAKGMLRVITFHVEGVRYLPKEQGEGKLQKLLLEWLGNSKAMLVVDESTAIKNPSADRTKFLVKHAPSAAYRRIMTGTQLTTGIENLYSQYKFLDPNILGHNTFTSFRAEYCIMGGYEGRQIIGYKNIERLIKILDGHSHRVLEKDCLDLPKQQWKRRQFFLAPKQEKLYEAYRKQSIEELTAILGEENGLRRAQEISVVRALRMHQIVCGLTPDENMQRLDGPNPRMEALMQEVEEQSSGGKKVLIWARFKLDLREISAKLGAQAVSYYGGISEDDRIAAIRRIQNDDKIRYFVASRAAARGLTLTAAPRSIYHSQSSSLDDRLQSQKRNHRIGTTERVLYTDLEAQCKASPDRKIINALRKNKELADQINQDPISIFMEEENE